MVGVVVFVNADLLGSMHALYLLKSSSWYLRCASYELDDLCQMLLIIRLQDLPEPLDGVICGSVP